MSSFLSRFFRSKAQATPVVANGVDFTSSIPPASLKTAKRSFVCRYLTGPYAMTLAEATAYIVSKISVVSVLERSATAALGGTAQGTADAASAITAAKALRQPLDSAIYTTVDFQPTTAQMVLVVAYVKAFAAAVRKAGYKAGLYGGTGTINSCRSLVDFIWQAAGWSEGVAVTCHIRQQLAQVTIDGHTCDEDQAFDASFGQWTTQTPVPTPAPKPVPKPTPAPKPVVRPTAADLKSANLRACKNVADATAAVKAGYELWYWNTKALKFAAQKNGKPTGVTLYVSTKFTAPKVAKP